MMNVIFAVLVLGVIAVVFGLVLSVAAKAFEVKVEREALKFSSASNTWSLIVGTEAAAL